MAQSSRPKGANVSAQKKKDAAKHAATVHRRKGKSKAATKFHTDELKSMLDKDASILYTARQNTMHTPPIKSHNTIPDASITDLADTLGNL